MWKQSDGILTCANGLVNNPDHWFNWVDLNCVPYTIPQVTVFAIGCLLWVVAYAIMLRNAFKYQFIEMAAIAGASNFAWEIVWGSFFYSTDMGLFLSWTYRAWLFFDVFIFWQLWKYGHKQYEIPEVKKYFRIWILAIVAFFFGFYYLLGYQGYETPIGSVSAYICQFLISVLCLLLLLRRKSLEGFSGHIAWMRTVGTILVSVFMFLHYPENHFVHLLCICSGLCDSLYCFLFYKRTRLP